MHIQTTDMQNMHIQTFFDSDTATFTHIVTDVATKKCAVIDPVLNYDPYSGRTSTHSADQVALYIHENGLFLEWILDTHIHADHITSAHYLKEKLGGIIGIGSKIKDVLALWVPIFNTHNDTPLDASQYDRLFEDGDMFKIGDMDVRVMHTPGHTPACVSYLIEHAIFAGDTLFMPDIGTARTDFPGGSAEILYDSVGKILALPDETRIFMCHDYPPPERQVAWISTVKEQKEQNVLMHQGVSKAAYVAARNQRDEGKSVPKLLLPSIQANLRAGTFGYPENNNVQYIKIPVNTL